jgi:hypothetical protein
VVQVRPRNASRDVGRRGTSERLQLAVRRHRKMELEKLVVRRKERGPKSVQRLEQSLRPVQCTHGLGFNPCVVFWTARVL